MCSAGGSAGTKDRPRLEAEVLVADACWPSWGVWAAEGSSPF